MIWNKYIIDIIKLNMTKGKKFAKSLWAFFWDDEQAAL